MSLKLSKILFLGLLLTLCMSVAMAADVSEDTASDVPATDISTENVDTVSTDNINNKNNVEYDNIENSNVVTTNTEFVTSDNFEVENDTTYDFSGTFTLGDLNYENLNNVVFTSYRNDAIFINTTFTLNGENIEVSNLKFENYNKTGNPITITANNSNIVNNNIKVVKDVAEETFGIEVTDSSNVNVENNYVNITAVPQPMGWETGVGTIKVSGIVFDKVNDSVINNNRLFIKNTTEVYPLDYTTMEAITVKGQSNDCNVTENTIMVEGSEYIYAISLSEFDNNINVERNYVELNGSNYVCGIQLASVTNSKVRKNTINGICASESGTGASHEAFAYGIAVLTATWGAPASEATGNIVDSNTITLHSTIAYSIELSNAEDTQVINNNGTVSGNVVMGLGIYNSSNCNITGNRFIVNGNTRTLNDSIYEAVYPVTTGIKIVDEESTNIIVSYNIIEVSDYNLENVYSVIIEDATGNNVTYNTLTATSALRTINGDETVTAGYGNVVENNN